MTNDFDSYKEQGFARIANKGDFLRLDRLAMGFLTNASLGRFSLENRSEVSECAKNAHSARIELIDYFVFLDEYALSNERQAEKLASFRNANYQESYVTQTQEEADRELLILAIRLFGSELFYRGVS